MHKLIVQTPHIALAFKYIYSALYYEDYLDWSKVIELINTFQIKYNEATTELEREELCHQISRKLYALFKTVVEPVQFIGVLYNAHDKEYPDGLIVWLEDFGTISLNIKTNEVILEIIEKFSYRLVNYIKYDVEDYLQFKI